MKLEIIPIKTRIVQPPKDDIWDIIDNLKVKDGKLICIRPEILNRILLDFLD